MTVTSPARIQQSATALGSLNLTAKRLVLRPVNRADLFAIVSLANDWDVARMLSHMPHPYGQTDAEDFIKRQEAEGDLRSGFSFAIEIGGRYAGGCGLHSREDGIELGYWLGRPFWGQGYATEAAARLCAFAFGPLGVTELVAGHFADNPASGRVLQKLGFAYTRDVMRFALARHEDVLCRMMALSGARFAAAQGSDTGGGDGG